MKYKSMLIDGVARNSTGPYIVTICGPVKFLSEMFRVYHIITELGMMAFIPDIDPDNFPVEDEPYKPEKQKLQNAKIEFGDAVLLINVDGYLDETMYHQWKLGMKYKKDIIWHHMILGDKEQQKHDIERTRELLAKFEKEAK